jgi:hypothetical protein
MRQAVGLESDVVLVVEVVEADNMEPVPQQPFSDVKTDEPCGAGHEMLVRMIHRAWIWTRCRIASTLIR